MVKVTEQKYIKRIEINFEKLNKKKALPCNTGNPCVHGTCTNDNLGGYTCKCTFGYWGKNCEYIFFLSNWPLLPIM